MPPKDGENAPNHAEVNAAARDINASYPELSFEAVRRSVLRNWQKKAKAAAEVRAKATQPCVIGIQVNGAHQQYLSYIQNHFYPVSYSSFPFFASAYRLVSTGDKAKHTWGNVVEKLNDPSTPHVHWIYLAFPVGVVPSQEAYESLYAKGVLSEGVRDTVAFVHTCDGTLPFGDYVALRNAGATPEEMAQLVDFAALGERAEEVQRQMKMAEDKVDLWLIEPDAEAAKAAARPVSVTAESRRSDTGSAAGEEVRRPRTGDSRASPVSSLTPQAAPPALLPSVHAPSPSHASYRALNLFANDPRTSIPWRENKAIAQQRLKELGLNHIHGVQASSAEEAVGALAALDISFPVIAKPVSGAGSEFVTLCSTPDELRTAFAICANQLTTQQTEAGNMVVEEYIDGAEYVVNIVSFEGRHVVTDVWRSWKYPFSCVSTRLRPSVETKIMENAEKDPSVAAPKEVASTSLLYDRLEFVAGLAEAAPTSEERRVVDYTLQCVTALGMVNGCSHCEVRVDERAASSRRGQPVLIELNPRMQGDAPRGTQLVGYDQYTLLFYLSAVAAAYERPLPTASQPLRVPQALRKGEKCSLPWPPVPQLYRSRQLRLQPGEEPVTRHVIFLTAQEKAVVCSYGAQKIMALPTFLRETRCTLFRAPPPGFLTTVRKTVDLFSSPGACVMEGTASDIHRDTAILRRIERQEMPAECRDVLLQMQTKTKELEAMTAEYNTKQEQYNEMRRSLVDVTRTAEQARREVEEMQAQTDGKSASTSSRSSYSYGLGSTGEGGAAADRHSSDDDTAHTCDELRERRDALVAKAVEMKIDLNAMMEELRANALQRAVLQQWLAERRGEVTSMLEALEEPPLFVRMPDFFLLRDACLGGLLGLPPRPTGSEADEEEEGRALTAVKNPRLRELYSASVTSAEEHGPTGEESGLVGKFSWLKKFFSKQ